MSTTAAKNKNNDDNNNKKKVRAGTRRKGDEEASLRALVLRVNTDEAYRAKFLARPVEELKRHGVILDDASSHQVRLAARDLRRRLPSIAKIPSGVGGILEGKPGSPHDLEILCI